MVKEITDSGVFELNINAKERALPNGSWKAGPFAGDILIAHQDYRIHPEPSLRYQFRDVASFVEYCKIYLDQDVGGIIFYTNDGLVGLHNHYVPTGNRVQYDFELSPELLAWKRVRSFSHKKFKNFLEERLDELVDTQLFAALTTLKLNTIITFESDLDDDRNFGFIYEEKSGKGTSKIPKYIGISVPFFANDPAQEISMKVGVKQPKSSEEKPSFTVEIIREERLLADNVAKLIVGVKTALPDHMILHGEI